MFEPVTPLPNLFFGIVYMALYDRLHSLVKKNEDMHGKKGTFMIIG
jgi:hypothetical protein